MKDIILLGILPQLFPMLMANIIMGLFKRVPTPMGALKKRKNGKYINVKIEANM